MTSTQYQYVVTAHKPTIVSHAVIADFISPRNLILARLTWLQVWSASRTTFSMDFEFPVYGRIAVLRSFRPRSSSLDWIFAMTERLQFCVIAYNTSTGQIDTKATGDASDKIGRLSELGIIGLVDPSCSMIGMHIYDGLLKVVPLSDGGTTFGKAYNMRFEELQIVSMTFLFVSPGGIPTLVVLFEDARRLRFVRTYIVDMEMKELKRGQWPDGAVDHSANRVEAIPSPLGGYLTFTNNEIIYRNGTVVLSTATSGSSVTAFGRVDEDGSRSLIGDSDGSLFVLQLKQQNDVVIGMEFERIGHVSQPSTLSYLDNGFVFVGSKYGDSMLIRLTSEPDNNIEFVSVQESFPNLGPIVDMAVLNMEQRCGQCQLITCSGTFADGSLRIVCNGIGMQVHSTTSIFGFENVWSVRPSHKARHHQLLVQSFPGESRVLELTQPSNDKEIVGEYHLVEADFSGFNCAQQTVFCGNILPNFVVQITPLSVRTISPQSWALVHEWTCDSRDAERSQGFFSLGTAAGNSIVVVLDNGTLQHLSVDTSGFIEVGSERVFQDDISCLSIEPDHNIIAVGFWSSASVRVLSLPTFEILAESPSFGEFSFPRSVSLTRFTPSSPLYLVCGLSDGIVISYTADVYDRDTAVSLKEVSRVIVGTYPVTLTRFNTRSKTYIFVLCDRSNLISYEGVGQEHDLIFTSCNVQNVLCMAPFHIRGIPTCVILGSGNELTSGLLDSVQKLHIRQIPLYQQPRRIVLHPNSHCLLVCTVALVDQSKTPVKSGDPTEIHYVKLYDDQTFQELQSIALHPYENACSAILAPVDGQDYFVVGTGYAMPGDEDSQSGRIIVYAIDAKRRQLVVDSVKTVNGAVWALNAFAGKILSTVNSMTYLWSRAPEPADDEDDGFCNRSLICECSRQGHVLSLFLKSYGNYFIVGDLLKSVSLLVYDPAENSLREIARDYDPNWSVCIEMLNDSTFLCANNSHNLLTMTRNVIALDEEERSRLQVPGRFHLGELVNVMHHGSLVATQNLEIPPQVLFGTTSGMVGVMASLSEKQFNLLSQLQTILQREVNSLGGLSHAVWRSYHNMEGIVETHESRNYIDGDLVERFLTLNPPRQQKIAQEIDMSLDKLLRFIHRLRVIY